MAFALPEDRAGGRWSVTGVTKTYDSKLRGERDGRTDRVGFKKDMYPPAHGFREFATNLRSARREPEYFEGLVNWRWIALRKLRNYWETGQTEREQKPWIECWWLSLTGKAKRTKQKTRFLIWKILAAS